MARELSSLNGKYGGLSNNNNCDASDDVSLLDEADGVLGFRLDDFDSSRFEDMGETNTNRGGTMIQIRRGSHRGSLLRNGYNTRQSRQTKDDETEEEEVPPWLPSIPTRSQIQCLTVKELKSACAQRGLRRTGRKAELQKRLLVWAAKKEGERVRSRLAGLRELLGGHESVSATNSLKTKDSKWAETEYNVDALTSRRKALNEQSSRGILGLVDQSYFDDLDEDTTDLPSDEQCLTVQDIDKSKAALTRTFQKPTQYSNSDLREMYIQAKYADQNGDRPKAKQLLHQLRKATPSDRRVIRRLSRMEMQDGNLVEARKLLQDGLRNFPKDAYLLHGLGQLERNCGNDSAARQYFREAMEEDEKFANPYHALGTMEHSHGNIKVALAVIKKGIEHCPTNHRLHHALGDIYLDAQMLDRAEEAYKKALQHVQGEWGKSFIYNSLSYVAYARRDIEECRSLLNRSLDVNNMHAQGVIALAQLEESEGNINDARKVYRDAIGRYEKKRIGRSTKSNPRGIKDETTTNPFHPSSFLENNSEYSSSYMGDKWINVFRSWARMEEIHGNYETAHIVFSRALRLFPESTVLLTEWAKLQVENGEIQKGKLLFEAACQRAGGG